MAVKYYAVQRGRNTGVFFSWPECQKQVVGFSGAVYKSFPTLEEAEAFVQGDKKHSLEMGNTDRVENLAVKEVDTLIAYVDGSYDHSILAYGAGVVLFYDKKKYTASKMNNHPEMVGMRNVAGEIEASMIAMRFAYEHQCQHLEICYDYEGIEKWCTGVWQANKPGTMMYRDYYLKMSQHLKITFKKIKSHSGNTLNDEADMLAKEALGLV